MGSRSMAPMVKTRDRWRPRVKRALDGGRAIGERSAIVGRIQRFGELFGLVQRGGQRDFVVEHQHPDPALGAQFGEKIAGHRDGIKVGIGGLHTAGVIEDKQHVLRHRLRERSNGAT
jgi:hypothetical protein